MKSTKKSRALIKGKGPGMASLDGGAQGLLCPMRACCLSLPCLLTKS
ncbi:MAG: hypothetical protein ACK50V_06940 [Alphaproteobacteria bacterium]|nr:hypothetical protein [Alphaproteobacteria bacterium]